jgi:oxygen-independent coproporphyrinogen-3 oxidase
MFVNFENIVYCKPETECIYNIQIMEEKQTILSAGAGSTTKIVYEQGKIDRIFNVKSLEDYINRIDEMIDRKKDGLPK